MSLQMSRFRVLVIAFNLVCGGVLLLAADSGSIVYAQAGTRLAVLQSDSSRIVLELSVSDYASVEQTLDGTRYSIVEIAGLSSGSPPGKPQLPTKGVLIGIPPGAQPSLKILDDQSQLATLARPVIPEPKVQVSSRPGQSLPTYVGKSYISDRFVYSANQLYPANSVRIASVGNWRSQRYLVVDFNPLQYNPVTRALVFHKRLRVEISFGLPAGAHADAFGGSVSEGQFESVWKNALLNYNVAKNWRSKSVPKSATAGVRAAGYSGGPWYRVQVSSDGIYEITCSQLASAGINLAALDPNTLRVFKNGTELAIDVQGSTWSTCDNTDFVEFYAQSAPSYYTSTNTSKYSSTNTYWLTYGGGTAHKAMTTRASLGSGTLATTFRDTIHLEQNQRYVPDVPRVDGLEHWYWDDVYQTNADPTRSQPSRDYAFQLDRLAAGSYSASLQADFIGYYFTNHHVQLAINDNPIPDVIWSGQVESRETVPFSQSLLRAGANKITVSVPLDPNSSDAIFTNYFDVSYQGAFTAVGDTIRFGQQSVDTWQYQIGGFTSTSIEAFDVSSPSNVVRIAGGQVSSSSPFTFTIADDNPSSREYIVLTSLQRKAPSSIVQDTPSNWQSPTNGADYVIIAPASFIPALAPLVSLRQSQGMRVQVVDVQDIYDEFNDGVMDPQAIRDFLAYAYAYWQAPSPAFVLLVGDATVDPKGYCTPSAQNPSPCPYVNTPAGSTLLPAFLRLVDPWLGETASDNRFVSFHDGDNPSTQMPDMAIGRLPANTTADVTAMVSKVVNYEQSPTPGDWTKQVSFVADNAYSASGVPDPAGDDTHNFWTYSEELAGSSQYVPAPYVPNRVYYNPCSPSANPMCELTPTNTVAAVKGAIRSAINNGSLIVNYVGHGAPRLWANEPLFQVSDVDALTNGGKLPVFLEMTCYTGYFVSPGASYQGLAEINLRAPGKGALASWSATGLGLNAGHDLLDEGFLRAVMWQNVQQLGPATVLGKANLFANSGWPSDCAHCDLIDTFTLFGDPASRLPMAPVMNSFLPFITRQ